MLCNILVTKLWLGPSRRGARHIFVFVFFMRFYRSGSNAGYQHRDHLASRERY